MFSNNVVGYTFPTHVAKNLIHGVLAKLLPILWLDPKDRGLLRHDMRLCKAAARYKNISRSRRSCTPRLLRIVRLGNQKIGCQFCVG
jgi:hypothetical protein